MIHLPFLITLQQTAALISFCGGVLIVCIVLFLVFTSSREEEKYAAKHKVYKVRGPYFWVLTLALVALLFISLRFVPYTSRQDKPELDVTVVGMQWFWKIGMGDSKMSPINFTGSDEVDLPVNKTIRFIVRAGDVNHGFGIYNSKGVLLAQTQAMPQYRNELIYRFKEAGEYEILCLEYCGMPHAYMTGKIHVK